VAENERDQGLSEPAVICVPGDSHGLTMNRTMHETEARLAAARAELARINAMIIAASDVERRQLIGCGSKLREEIMTLEMMTSPRSQAATLNG
jgi:hypothetical protein